MTEEEVNSVVKTKVRRRKNYWQEIYCDNWKENCKGNIRSHALEEAAIQDIFQEKEFVLINQKVGVKK